MRIDEKLQSGDPCFSVEFFPPKDEPAADALEETLGMLGPMKPCFYSVTYGAVGAQRNGTVELTNRLQSESGVDTMAHLSCVGESVDGIRRILDDLVEGGVENVLALRGDPPRGEGEFTRPENGLGGSAELAALIRAEYPQISIGASCFPEVHPEAPSAEADLAYLKTKVESGADFLISQLFFDNETYFDFVDAARSAGIEVPIIPGLMPITSYKSISRMAGLCEASIPEELAGAMDDLEGDQEAEAQLGLAYASQQASELMRGGAPGIHFYSLNRWPSVRALLATLAATRPWREKVTHG